MTETPLQPNTPETGPAAGEAQQPNASGPRIRVLAQYVKDLSFENPNPLASAQASQPPAIELGIDVRAEPLANQEDTYEVDLRMSAHAKRDDSPVFIAELVYSGVFNIQGTAAADAEPILLIECPRLLFPFARRVMAEITREGGFPPLLVDPIDFVNLYRAQKQQQAQMAAQQQQQQGTDLA